MRSGRIFSTTLLALALSALTPIAAFGQPSAGVSSSTSSASSSATIGPRSLDRLGPTGAAYARAALRVASAEQRAAYQAGTLPLATFFDLAAVGAFGEAAFRPVKYVAFKQGLEKNGLSREDLGRFVGDFDLAARDRVLAGELTPREIFAHEASVRSSWRASGTAMPYASFREKLGAENQLGRLDAALASFSPLDREALERGKLSPARTFALIEKFELEHPDVVIVGAGISGMRAARALIAAGKRVVILEAGEVAGGRVRTDATTFSNPLDAGGAWIHNSFENPTAPFASNLGLTLVRDVPNNLLVFDGTNDLKKLDEAAFEAWTERATAAAEKARAEGRDVSLAEAMGTRGSSFHDIFLANVHHGVSTTRDLSATDFLTMAEESEDRLVKEGMGTIPEAMGWGLPIKTKTPVEKIEWGKGRVRVHAGGTVYDASRVIVTTSPTVLASGAIEFSPKLPSWKTKAFENVKMGRYAKVMLELEGNVLDRVPDGTRIYDTTREGGVVEYVVKPFGKKGMVIALFSGKLAEAMERSGVDAAVADVKGKLATIFGEAVKKVPSRGAITTWVTDPLTRGSFSAAAPGHFEARELLGRPTGEIFFAGEAMAPGKWAATIAGAWLSGDNAASDVLGSLGEKRVTDKPADGLAPPTRLADMVEGKTVAERERLATAIKNRGRATVNPAEPTAGLAKVLERRVRDRERAKDKVAR